VSEQATHEWASRIVRHWLILDELVHDIMDRLPEGLGDLRMAAANAAATMALIGRDLGIDPLIEQHHRQRVAEARAAGGGPT
jgi:hypothetical protein